MRHSHAAVEMCLLDVMQSTSGWQRLHVKLMVRREHLTAKPVGLLKPQKSTRFGSVLSGLGAVAVSIYLKFNLCGSLQFERF